MFFFVDFHFITTICGNQAAMNTNMRGSFCFFIPAHRLCSHDINLTVQLNGHTRHMISAISAWEVIP